MQPIRGHNVLRALAHRFAIAVLSCAGAIAWTSTTQAAAVTFNYTGSDVSYTISPGAYRITVYGAQGGDACTPACSGAGGHGAEASAIYQIGQTLDLRIGVGGAAPANGGAAGGGGASFVDFEIGDPGLDILLLVGGGGGGGSQDNGSGATGGTVERRRRIRRLMGWPESAPAAAAADMVRMVSQT
jgi:Glycine rich protein